MANTTSSYSTIEASLLDSDVQELLGTEELAGDEPARGPQHHLATRAAFLSIVRWLDINCCARFL